MTTIAAGSPVTGFVPVSQTITFTPGTGGRISFNGRNQDGSAITPREIYAETAIAMAAGSTFSAEAIGVDGSHTDIQSSVSGGGGDHWKFRDTFGRADTLAPAVGGGWVAKGAYVSSYPLPAATDGKITNRALECPGGLATYWMRALPAVPVTIKARMSWLDLANGQAGYQTFALICTNSAANLIDNMGVHLTLTHTTLRVQERLTGGAFVDLMPIVDIQPRLSLADGENELTVTLNAAANRGEVKLNERTYAFASSNLAANIGATIAVEWAQTGGASNRWRGRIHEVAANW